MGLEFKRIAIKVIGTLIITPLMGYALLGCAELLQKAWNSNSRKKRWLAMCMVFLLLAAISGWFQ